MVLDNKIMEEGHIIAVRYCWNSYVGVLRNHRLSLWEGADRFRSAAQSHGIDETATYQIIGHIDCNHPDFHPAIIDWFSSENGNCPIRIRVYENMAAL